MKVNEHTAILTRKILLVPYSERHVPTYHEWMQDEDIQKATASEPLTLEEEYAMQKSWREDADKLTFIVCIAPEQQNAEIQPGKEDAPKMMIGDVNLFLFADEDSDEEEENSANASSSQNAQSVVGEVEIMIARKDFQGKRLGKEVLLTFLWYILTSDSRIMHEYHLANSGEKSGNALRYLRVKIGHENVRSIKLFESVGFQRVNDTPNYFGELELRWPLSDHNIMGRETEPASVDYR